MDSLPFSQSGLLGTQGEDPCFMVMNSQVEESQDAAQAVKMSNTGLTGPNKQRMLWELAALRGTQPSPVLIADRHHGAGHFTSLKPKDRKHPQNEEFKARTMTGSQPTNPQQGSSSAPNQGDGNQGTAAGNDGTGGSNQGNRGQDAGSGAAGGGEGGGNGGEEGGGGDGEDDDEEDDHEETGEEISQDTSSSHSSVPKLVPPPALHTPPRTVRVKEIVGGTVGSPATSPDAAAGPEQSDDDQGVGSERGGGVSDAPTAVVGDSTDEGQGAVTTPSPPSERSRDTDGQAGGSGLMDPPLHSMIPRKRSSDTSHSSISSSSSHSTNSSSYHASHDTASSSLLSSLSTSSSSSSGVQATSSGFTQVKEHPAKPSVPLPRTPSHVLESFRGEASGEGETEHPQSSQQDLFADVAEEKRADRVRVLANETSTSEDASIAEIPPTPEAYKYGFQDTPPHKLDQTLRHHQDPGSLHQLGEQVLVNETSTSDDASVTIIQPSPEAWGTVIANTPPHKIEQYSRSSRSAHEGSDRTPSTPSETLGSLHLSGQQELSGSQDSGPSIIPPTLGAYGSIPQLIPSTPTPQDEEEPMELSIPDDDDVAMTTHPAKRPKSAGVYDDEYGIPEWQQVLNKEEQAALSRSSSTSSKTTTSSSDQSSQSFGRISAQMRGQQIESFQAWQPSSQQTTSTTSEEPSRSRPPSTPSKPDVGEPESSRKRQDQDNMSDKPRSVSALARTRGKVEGGQQQEFLSQPARDIPEDPTSTSKFQQQKQPSVPDEPATHQPAIPQPHQETSRLTQLKTKETGQREPTKASSSLSSGEKQERRQGEDVKEGEVLRHAGRGGSSDEWMLHYTATQTDTEAEAFEEGTRKGSSYEAHPALSTTSAPQHPEEAVAISTTRGGATAAHTLMSYTDATSSSTTASSDAKKKGEDDKELQRDKRDFGVEAPPRASMRTPEAERNGARSRTDTQSRTDAQSRADDPKHSVSLAIPGPESQSADPTEFSSIDFHLSLPTQGGLRPAGGVTLPSLAHRQKERSSSRQPIRHSTPIMDESPDRQQGQETAATSTTAQVGAPKLVRSSTLTLGADIEPETQDGSETPVFQLERPSDAAQLLKAAHESPSKKSTSVFSKVHETKMAASQIKVKGQASRNGRVKYSESDDPFALSQEHPRTASRHPQEPELSDQQKQAEVEDEDEETIPVYYQEEELEGASGKTERKEETGKRMTGGREMLIAEPEGQSEKGRKKAGVKTPEKRQQESEMPALSSRLTRSGQKRKLQEERPEDRKGRRGGAAKKKRLEEAEQRGLRERPPGPRDPYDFSDSQSNKTPSPMKKDSRAAGSKPPPSRDPTTPLPQLKIHLTKHAAAAPSTTRSATTPGSTTRETPKRRQKRDTGKEAPTPGEEKTPPVQEILEASGLASRTTPKRGSFPGSKSGPIVKTSSTRGRRPGSGRQRLASQQVLQAQQDDSSPDFQPDQPREKKGVKFRRSPRKKQSQKQEKPAASDPTLPRRHIIRQTTEYRLIHEKIIVDGKVIKTWETREQVGPLVETVEDEDSLDLPSPSRSISSLTSGSLADVSSMYSKTSSSTPSLVRTLSGSGGTLSKHSSFSSISRTGSSLSKQTVSSPGSDKSTPSLNKSLSSPGSDKSPGNERKAGGGVPSPGVAGPSIPRRVSFTRGTSQPPSLARTSSGSGDEIHHQPDQDPKAVFQKPYQTPRRKVDHQQGDGFAQRLSLQDAGEAKTPEEVVTHERLIPASKVAELVQLSQECVPVKEMSREDKSPRRSTEMKLSRRQTKDKTAVSSSSPHPPSSPSGRRSSRASSVQSEQDTSDRRSIPRTRSTPARVTIPVTRSPSASSGEEIQRSTRRSEGKGQDSVAATSGVGKLSLGGSKKTSVEQPTPEHSPREEPQLEPQTQQTRRESLASAPSKEDVQQATGEKMDAQEDPRMSSDPERGTPRSSRGKARGTTKKRTPSPTSLGRPSTPPRQSTKPLTSDPSSSFPRDTLFEPPAGETLPIAEGEVALLLPGLKVYTKWLDGFWYPGTIHHQDKLSRFVIEFDDGDHRTVNERDIIIKEWLNRGQSVMAEDADGYYYAGVVVGYYKDPDANTSGYVIEQTISHETSRYERRHVILTKDQAATLVSSASSSSSTSGGNLISLDNIVYSKRTRLRSRLLESPSSGGLEKSPRQPQKTTPLRQGVKRKLAPLEEQKIETPSPRKRGRPTAQAAVTPSPDPGTSPRRSPRKRQQQQQSHTEEAHAMAAHMGPIPKQATLFRNHAFLVTHGEVKKSPPKEKTSSSESMDESSGEGPDEIETVPFDRSYAVQQIEHGGGLVLSDFNKSQITKMKVLLIANTYCRTKKYFQALAAGIPCISHLWLRDCCKSGRLQNHKSYLLPAGESLEENALMEIQPNRSILAGMNVCMVSDLEGVQDTWRSILIAAGCHIVTRLPSNLEVAKDPSLSPDCNMIVTDPSCPRSLLHRAQRLSIPVVSCEWVMQCLINGVRVPYHSHKKYAWDYRDKPTK